MTAREQSGSAVSDESSKLVAGLVARARVAQRAIDAWTQAQVDELVTAAGWAIEPGLEGDYEANHGHAVFVSGRRF